MRLFLRGTERFVQFGEQNLLRIKHPQKGVVSSAPAPASLNVHMPETNEVKQKEQSHPSFPPKSHRTALKRGTGAGVPRLKKFLVATALAWGLPGNTKCT